MSLFRVFQKNFGKDKLNMYEEITTARERFTAPKKTKKRNDKKYYSARKKQHRLSHRKRAKR